MKNYFLPILFLALISCEKDNYKNEEFTYDYKVSVKRVLGEFDGDSLVYYYDTSHKLLRVERFHPEKPYYDHMVTYNEDYIDNWNGIYRLNAKGKIASIDYYGTNKEMEYDSESGNLIYQKTVSNGTLAEECFYEYLSEGIRKDSTVVYQPDAEPAVTVNESEYLDLIKPYFMVSYSGLSMMQQAEERLLKQSRSTEHHILNVYTYIITENCVKEVSESYDERNNQIINTITSVFRLIKNNNSK